jgi:hypothetical protein
MLGAVLGSRLRMALLAVVLAAAAIAVALGAARGTPAEAPPTARDAAAAPGGGIVTLPADPEPARPAGPATRPGPPPGAWRRAELRRLRGTRSVEGALRRAWLAGTLARAEHDAHRRTWADAGRLGVRLPGVRGAELRAARAIVADLAARGRLTTTARGRGLPRPAPQRRLLAGAAAAGARGALRLRDGPRRAAVLPRPRPADPVARLVGPRRRPRAPVPGAAGLLPAGAAARGHRPPRRPRRPAVRLPGVGGGVPVRRRPGRLGQRDDPGHRGAGPGAGAPRAGRAALRRPGAPRARRLRAAAARRRRRRSGAGATTSCTPSPRTCGSSTGTCRP